MHVPLPLLGAISLLVPLISASVTVYSQAPLGSPTTSLSAAGANYTGAAAYDPTILTAPPIPSGDAMPRQFSISLASSEAGVNGGAGGLSIPLSGSFLGFSIEFSVITQVRE